MWSHETRQAFEALRVAVDQCPILAWLTQGVTTILCTDACQYGIGGYLYQLLGDKEIPIAFVSKALTEQQAAKWSTIEKEGFAIYYCLQKLQYLLRDIHFTVKTDHLNLAWRFLNNETNPRVKRWKLAIQEFDFDIEYLEGSANIAADCLSRMPHELTHGVEDTPLLITMGPDAGTNISEVNETRGHMKEAELPQQVPHTTSPTQHELTKERYQLMLRYHNARAGHVGTQRLMDRLTRHLFEQHEKPWPYMRGYVKQFIRLCPCCQKMASTKLAIQVTPFTLARYQPMECWNVDTIGPLPEDTHGNKFIIVLIDMFTRFVELRATVTTDAATAARFMYEQMGRYGTPKQILSDNGTQFCNELFTEYCRLSGVQQLFVLAYSKEENGLVERANKSVMTHLRNLIVDRTQGQLPWSDRLPMVQRIINAMEHTVLGVSPQQLLYGNAIDIERRVFLASDEVVESPSIEGEETDTVRKWFANMLAFQEQVTISATANQRKKDNQHLDEHATTRTQFEVGQLVLIDYPHSTHGRDQPSRFHPNKRGPFRVTGTEGNRLTIEDLHTGKAEEHLILNARPFYFHPDFVDPKEITLTDNDLYIVEQILAHQGNPKAKKSLEFKVKWLGYPTPTWEPYHNLRTNARLHEYLRKDPKLRTLIPKGFT